LKSIRFLFHLLFFLQFINVKAQWPPLNSTTTNVLTDIYFVNDSLGYFADEGKFIYKTEDGGLNWNLKADSLGRTVYFLTADTGFAVYNNIYKTVDGGNTWIEVFQSAKFINSLCFTNNGI
jgi:hypothetical protein